MADDDRKCDLEPGAAPAGVERASGDGAETTSAVLRRLDSGGFSLEATWKVSMPRELRRDADPDAAGKAPRDARWRAARGTASDDEAPSREGKNKAGGGFNPYDHS